MPEFKVEIADLYKVFGRRSHDMMPLIRNGVSKSKLLEEHDHVLALNNINLTIKPQEIHVVMGLSGSGKSTLIRHINRLIEPTSGTILYEGSDILSMDPLKLREFRRFKASMVFQNFSLLPHRTVSENIAYGMKIQQQDPESINNNMRRWIERVELNGYEKYYPAQLSGGMQQRVGIARALATDSELLLMDEPFSALDPLIRNGMQDVLLGLQRELSKTIIFITHDLNEAIRLGNQITILKDGEVVQSGSSQEIILRPADSYVADFTKDINRGKMIQVGSIAELGLGGDGPEIDKNESIEDALQIINLERKTGAVVTDKNKPIGKVTLDMIIRAHAKDFNTLTNDK
tara:strand:+ start:76 stop:1113 length:1038 start_codon:yes stop_codon:yes gene_type:complete